MSTKRKSTTNQNVQKQWQTKCQAQARTFKKQIATLQLKNKQCEQRGYERGYQAALKTFQQLENNWERTLTQANTTFAHGLQKVCAPYGIRATGKTGNNARRGIRGTRNASTTAQGSSRKNGTSRNGMANRRLNALSSYRFSSARRHSVGGYHS